MESVSDSDKAAIVRITANHKVFSPRKDTSAAHTVWQWWCYSNTLSGLGPLTIEPHNDMNARVIPELAVGVIIYRTAGVREHLCFDDAPTDPGLSVREARE
jgi:hypothetical protein